MFAALRTQADAPTRTEAPQRTIGDARRAASSPARRAARGRPAASALVRWALFLLLPLALIAGGYWYVTGGQVMSTDDAYVEADKVGVSTDVSGIVKEVDVTENQHVKAGQVLYRLDDLPFQLALDRAKAQVGMVADALNALKANYRDMQAQIKQAQNDIDYYNDRIPPPAGPAERTCRVAVDLRHGAPQPAERAAEARLAQPAARRDRRQSQRRSRRPGRAEPAVSRGRGTARRGGAPARPHRRQGAVRRHRDERAFDRARQVSAASTTAFYLVATDHVWVDANPKETELTYVRPGQPVDGDGRHLSRTRNGTAPSRASARRRRRSSRCCRRRTPAATG